MIISITKQLICLGILGLALSFTPKSAQSAAPEVTQLINHEKKFGEAVTPSKLPPVQFLERTQLILNLLEARPDYVTDYYASSWRNYAAVLKDDVIPALRLKQATQKDSVKYLDRAAYVLRNPVVVSKPKPYTYKEGGSSIGELIEKSGSRATAIEISKQ